MAAGAARPRLSPAAVPAGADDVDDWARLEPAAPMTATTDARPARPVRRRGPPSPTRAAPPRRAAPPHQPAAEFFLALVTLAVIVGFARIFTGADLRRAR